jgi:hypothetical protein
VSTRLQPSPHLQVTRDGIPRLNRHRLCCRFLKSGKGTSPREGSEETAASNPVLVERGSDASENLSPQDLEPCDEAGEIFEAID